MWVSFGDRSEFGSIQVFAQYDRTHSHILAQQRASEGGSSLSGAL